MSSLAVLRELMQSRFQFLILTWGFSSIEASWATTSCGADLRFRCHAAERCSAEVYRRRSACRQGQLLPVAPPSPRDLTAF
jgi:hypothetical protein